MVQGILIFSQVRNTLAEKFMSRFPTHTFQRSSADRCEMPMMLAGFLNAGGPGGPRRADDQLLHGVPIQTAQTLPPMISPRTYF